ncbi:hypothetical protein INT47_005456 [Mucor saturninus]|uniref:Symplekin/Pta1 N-terminal domain-containing protein n=1 Tax=Mucor saturninus TaxID=64648 RepID=A0A8H7RDW2_9FUNG|nr:hypothetical protein INT47_005456 [Mucor saturninus]
MDHDQQVLQLRDFDQQVLSQPENAQSFATRSFLETLVDLLQYGLEKQDDGTDAYKEELKIIKNATKAFSTVLPTVYKTVCQNEAETRLWSLCLSLMTLVDTSLIHHSNAGVQINAVKCLQVLVLLLSKSTLKDISLNLPRPDHRLLNVEELEKKGQDMFSLILSMLKSDIESVITATVSCLMIIGKKRPQFVKQIMAAFAGWRKTRSKDDSPVMLRNVDKALKLAFVSLIRTDAISSFRSELIAAFGSIGGNVAMFQSRHSREQRAEEARRAKRSSGHLDTDRQQEKRAKTEYMPIIPSATSNNILANYDITQIPLSAIVNLCMTVLQTVPLEVMSERVSLLPAQGVTLAVTRTGFVRSTTPPFPPPPEQPQYNTNPLFKKEGEEKKEKVEKEEETDIEMAEIKAELNVDSDEEMENNFKSLAPVPLLPNIKQEQKPKVPVLASVEERASQALKMQPYELAEQRDLSESEKKQLLKMAIKRILYAEKSFQSTTHDATPTTAKSRWLLLVAKLVTRGVGMQPASVGEGEEDEDKKVIPMDLDETNEIKELLLDFVVEDLLSRHDLALEWLHEEYLSDQRQSRLNANFTASYYLWFHKLLKKTIPTLDAKDKILTKLLLEAPELNEETIELVKENLQSVPERFVSCVSTLRNIVINRPTVRWMALQVLLDLCINENDQIRQTSIMAVKKWNENQTHINTRVESYSVEALQVLATEGSWDEKDVVRHAQLYFVLCTRRPSLLKELFSVYIKASESVQKYIRLHMIKMIKAIGMKSSDLNKLIREFPPGGETLVIRILVILCDSKPPTREIVSAVQEISVLANERSIDLKNLSPILTGHSLNQKQQQ